MSKRWSYQTIEIKTGLLNNRPSIDEIQQELTRHGNLGWELVNIVALPMSPTLLVFKKEQ